MSRLGAPLGQLDSALEACGAKHMIVGSVAGAFHGEPRTTPDSERQLRDVTGVLVARGGELDRNYLDHWAAELDVFDLWRQVSR